jgi:hypothetical protein
MSIGLGLHPSARHGQLRTGLSSAYSELPWVDWLADYPRPRIEQIRDLLDQDVSPLSRHFLMNQLEADTYATRDEGIDKLAFYDLITGQHHAEMDSIRPALLMRFGAVPLLETYRQASIRHERHGDTGTALLWAQRGVEVYGDDASRQEWVDDLTHRAGRLRRSSSRPERPMPVAHSQVPKMVLRVAPPAAPAWTVGVRVTHDTYGMGTVVDVLENQVLVDFGEDRSDPRPVRSQDRRMTAL